MTGRGRRVRRSAPTWRRRWKCFCGLPWRCPRLLALVAVGWGLAVGASPALAQSPLLLDEGQLWNFGEHLFRKGEYFRAISEYKRVRHFFPSGQHAPAAALRIGEAYLRGGEAPLAIQHLGTLLSDPALSGRHDDVRFLRGLGWLERDRDRPYPLRESLIAAGLRDLRAIGQRWPGYAAVQGFLAAMDSPPELPRKSPLLAGSLSAVVPGAGSFYVGRYAEGSLALFVNGLLIFATVNSFQQEQVALGTVLGTLALAFYGGSIYAAANGAHKFNSRAHATYLQAQRRRFGLVIQQGAVGGAFNRRF